MQGEGGEGGDEGMVVCVQVCVWRRRREREMKVGCVVGGREGGDEGRVCCVW